MVLKRVLTSFQAAAIKKKPRPKRGASPRFVLAALVKAEEKGGFVVLALAGKDTDIEC